jgi:hypothetical protein
MEALRPFLSPWEGASPRPEPGLLIWACRHTAACHQQLKMDSPSLKAAAVQQQLVSFVIEAGDAATITASCHVRDSEAQQGTTRGSWPVNRQHLARQQARVDGCLTAGAPEPRYDSRGDAAASPVI